jgi:hypothetical protein
MSCIYSGFLGEKENFIAAINSRSVVSDELVEDLLIKQFIESLVEVITAVSEPDAFKYIGVLFGLLRQGKVLFHFLRPIDFGGNRHENIQYVQASQERSEKI